MIINFRRRGRYLDHGNEADLTTTAAVWGSGTKPPHYWLCTVLQIMMILGEEI